MNNFKLSGNVFEPHAGRLYESTNVINVGEKGRIFSVAAGTAMYLLAGGNNKGLLKKLLRFGGLYFLYRGISGNCPVSAMLQKNELKPHTPAVNIRTSLIVNAPRKMVYDAWRDLERLPRFLKHIKRIKVKDEIHSHWVLKTPGSVPAVEWDAEIIEQEDGRELSWRSLPGSMVETAGKINFADTAGGTELIILITYRPPAGYIGSAIARLLNSTFKNIVEQDVLGFKKYIERKTTDENLISHNYI
jgi:uncharacterized membrane protein